MIKKILCIKVFKKILFDFFTKLAYIFKSAKTILNIYYNN